MLRSRKEVRRIPLTAIERVEIYGFRGHTLAVILTGPEPDAVRAHRFVSLRPAAVKHFATVLREALPVRDDAELGPAGSSLVTVEPLERQVLPALRWDVFVPITFCLVMAALLATRSWIGAFCWVFVPMLVGAGISLVEVGWKPVSEGWILAVRGITVEGQRKNSGSVDTGDPDASYVYLFTDAEGALCAYRGTNGGRDEEEIIYDPRNPGVNQLQRRAVHHRADLPTHRRPSSPGMWRGPRPDGARRPARLRVTHGALTNSTPRPITSPTARLTT
ncbi:hypothetical protein [Streptomyces sp. NPDC090093]|uniref:hypothetical protein n=1 Tax=Streptomyces sp. NPDC090093 TaxID=3365945 RepID=UPI0038275F1C